MTTARYRIAIDVGSDLQPVGWSVTAFSTEGVRLWCSVQPQVGPGTLLPAQALEDALDLVQQYGIELPLPLPEPELTAEPY